MKLAKPLVISFSLLAFAGAAAADDAAKNKGASQAQSQPQAQQQSGASAGASGQQAGGQQSMSEMRASELKDKKVTDNQGEDIGEISEVVVDLQSGKVHAAVLEFGGFLGLGEKHYAFPVSDLQPGKDRNKLSLNIDKDKLKNAEGFAKGQYPEMDDDYWGRIGSKQSSAGSGAQPGQKANLMRSSKLIGQDVVDKSGKEVGEIKDLVMDLQTGELKNVVIDVKGAGQAMVEAKSISSGTGDKLLISMDEQQLKSQAQKTDRRADRATERDASAGSTAPGRPLGAPPAAPGSSYGK